MADGKRTHTWKKPGGVVTVVPAKTKPTLPRAEKRYSPKVVSKKA